MSPSVSMRWQVDARYDESGISAADFSYDYQDLLFTATETRK